jgi:hypothetical protein
MLWAAIPLWCSPVKSYAYRYALVLRNNPTTQSRITEPRIAVNKVNHQPPPAVLKKLSRKPPISAGRG